jgi:hypothetical protein
MEIWKLIGARQASYGIPAGSENSYRTVRESHGELELSDEYGRPLEVVETLPDDATDEDQWNALARLENWPETYAEQAARIAALDAEDDAFFASLKAEDDDDRVRTATPEEVAEVERRYGQSIDELVAEAERGYDVSRFGSNRREPDADND